MSSRENTIYSKDSEKMQNSKKQIELYYELLNSYQPHAWFSFLRFHFRSCMYGHEILWLIPIDEI